MVKIDKSKNNTLKIAMIIRETEKFIKSHHYTHSERAPSPHGFMGELLQTLKRLHSMLYKLFPDVGLSVFPINFTEPA